MSATEQGLLRAILETPADDVARLVYADWLDEHEQSDRAEFIRTQIRLANLESCGHRSPKEGCERCGLVRAEHRLLTQHREEWLSLPGSGWQISTQPEWRWPDELKGRPRIAGFQRGFIAFVIMPTDEFYNVANLVVQNNPIERIQLSDRWPDQSTLGADQVYFWSNGHTDEGSSYIPHYLCSFAEEGFPTQQPWPTEAGALEALSNACLACGRNYGNKLGRNWVYTTGQVAKILQVSPSTVTKWFDSEKLRGYRIPGSQDRRIPREQLVRFIRENGLFAPPPRPEGPLTYAALPTPEEMAEQRRAFLEKVRDKELLTTGEVARICQVASRRVVKWIDSGRLPGQRSSSGKHRLTPRAALVAFLERYSMRVEGFSPEPGQT